MKMYKYQLVIGKTVDVIIIGKLTDKTPMFVGIQGASIYLWVGVDVDDVEDETILEVEVVGTGWDFDKTDKHLGTVIDEDGFVWHAFLKERANG
jgi:hypothetical protein